MSKLKLSSNASGSGNVTLESPNTDSDFTVTVPSGTGALPLMKLETAVSASGTAVDFTGIPSWVKRITVMFAGVSTNGSSNYLVQLGDSGGVETTGYLGGGSNQASDVLFTNGFGILWSGATVITHGSLILNRVDPSANTWVATGMFFNSASASTPRTVGSSKTLSNTLTQVRITTVNGTDTFDAGTINILYEG